MLNIHNNLQSEYNSQTSSARATNPAAAKRILNDDLFNKWRTEWPQSTRGKRMKKIDKSMPSTKFLKTISKDKLSREAASRIAQLRMRHIPLKSYLYKFKRADKTNCPACGEDYKTPPHFLLSCPTYAFERWALERQVKKKKKSLTLEVLLGDPDLALLLTNYIDGTNRFKQSLSEQQHTQNHTTSQDSN